ncbi:MAG: BON domain-containing protein [Steroidobacter sp.]
MSYSNRSDWNRDRERQSSRQQQDWDEESRRAHDSMERDRYGAEGRGGYGGGREDEGPRYGQRVRQERGYGQGEYDQEFGQERGGRYSESSYGRAREGRDHYGNDTGGWPGREREQWRNRSAHGEYDRNANYGGYSSSGTGNYAGYGGSGGSYRGGRPEGDYDQGQRRYGRGETWNEGGHGMRDFDEVGYGQGSSRPSGGRAFGNYGATNYGGTGYGEQYGRRDQWSGSSQDQQPGQHRGRGPKGYRRSDERVREEVCDCLADDDRLDASNIDVVVKEGEVQLSGTVNSRDDKRWAEILVERISGVKEVQNSLRVQEQQRTQPGAGTQGAGTAAAGGKDKAKESNIQH